MEIVDVRRRLRVALDDLSADKRRLVAVEYAVHGLSEKCAALAESVDDAASRNGLVNQNLQAQLSALAH